MQSRDVVDGNVEKIAALFPQCVTERLNKDGKPELAIDFDKLRAELSNDAFDDGEERYQFTWPDKRAASRLANEPVNLTLHPCREESVGKDGMPGDFTSENLYIEGDNLDVLKVLRETYLGRVKMIYIDPPYNTGNDFVYNDDFAQGIDEFEQSSGAFDADGNQTLDPMQRNTEANGRFHTDWLNMIYPRLKIARDLLSDDGVIFISIDEHELENLKKICKEIFGESNYIGDIIIQSNPRGSMSSAELASLHEYLLLCAKNRAMASVIGHKLSAEMLSEYKYCDSKGPYRLIGLRMRGGFWRRTDRPKLYFPIYINPKTEQISLEFTSEYSVVIYPTQPTTGEDGTWRWSKEKILSSISELIPQKVTRNGQLEWDIYQKDYLNREEERRTKAKSIWSDAEMNYQNGTTILKKILGNSKIFDYSKPVDLIVKSMEMIDTTNSIILDFFSGSATTAHAVMKLNAEDGGKRKFIMVQFPEVTDEKSEARKAGYENICEIGKERIRRAGKKIREEAGQAADGLDIGFRVLKLDSSNMEDVFYTPDKFEPSLLDSLVDNIKADRSGEDLLFQVMLNLGIELSAKIERKEIAGKEVFSVDDDYLLACFDKDVNETTIEEMAKLHPTHLVIRDASAANDNVLDNFDQIIQSYSNEKKITTHIL